jgi:hypothetical protein
VDGNGEDNGADRQRSTPRKKKVPVKGMKKR